MPVNATMTSSLTIGKDLDRIINDCAEVAGTLWERGWAERNAGNLSVNVTDLLPREPADTREAPFVEYSIPHPPLGGSSLLISGTGRRMRDLARNPVANSCVLRISEDLSGYHVLWGGKHDGGFKPTSELPSHLAIHSLLTKTAPDKKAVLHTHPNELIALTHYPKYKNAAELTQLLWSMHPETVVFLNDGIGLVPYRAPGTDMLADATVEALEDYPVVLWEKHGCVAVGQEILGTFDLIDTLNKSAGIFLLCRSAGFVPEGLSKEQIEEIQRLFGAGFRVS